MIGVVILCVIVMILMTIAIIHDKKGNGDKCIEEKVVGLYLPPKSLNCQFYDKLNSLDLNKNVLIVDGISIEKHDLLGFKLKSELVTTIEPILFVYEDGYSEYYVDKLLTLHYPNVPPDTLIKHFMLRVLEHSVVEDNPSTVLENKLKPFELGIFPKSAVSWVEIGNCEYFAKTYHTIYRFSDWKILSDREAVEVIKSKEIKRCTNPKKTYWKHFLELEMKDKKQREVECAEFITAILSKQQEYNDLQYKYEMLPSAPITDYESFCNFCKLVNETVIFKDYEITNMLLLKRNEQNLKEGMK